jgi:hypothetical protein
MFPGEMSSVRASHSLAFVTTNRFAKIRKYLGSRLVVVSASRLNQLLGFAKPFLWSHGHLHHSILTFSFTLGRFAPSRGYLLLLLFSFMFDSKYLCPIKQLLERAAQGNSRLFKSSL